MTEQEWLTCRNPEGMLATFQLQRHVRKMRLLLIAHCRRAWEWLSEAGRTAVLVAERFADGQATAEELGAAWLEASYIREDRGYELDDLVTGQYGDVFHEGEMTFYESRLDPEKFHAVELECAA